MGSPNITNSDALPIDPIPLSALQHAVYCLRQAALIHLERLWEENRLTAEGTVLHLASDDPTRRKVRGIRRVSALQLSSARLGVTGVADLVEFIPGGDGETPYPIEIKRGRPKLHRADEVQLCAQGICLEEMTGRCVPEGAIFYAQTKRRTIVHLDEDLRTLTEQTIADLREVFRTEQTPVVTYRADRCRACSLIELCHPQIMGRSALAWRYRTIRDTLRAGDEG